MKIILRQSKGGVKLKNCKMCGREHIRTSDFCSQSCYFKNYYNNHKERLLANRKQWHKNNYVPHPIPKKTDEELRQRRINYYNEHKDYYKQKHKEWYEEHKYDVNYVYRRKLAQKKYFEKLKKIKRGNENE